MTPRTPPAPGEAGRAGGVRLFAALELPPAVADALAAWRAPLLCAAGSGLRPVRAEDLHVTLCFLGARPADAVEAIGAVVARCAEAGGGVPGLALGEPLWLPPRRPHVLAAGVADETGALRRLQAQLAERLAADGWYAPEARPYLPHATVARVPRTAQAPRRRALPPLPRLAFAGAAVTLFRSRLSPAGARYEALFRRSLA